jgi:hypothetical protein
MRRASVIGLVCALTAATGLAAGASSLNFRRAGGSAIVFTGKLYAWCGPWEPDVKVPAVHVLLVPPAHGSYWLLSGVLRDVRRQARVRFPVGFTWNRPKGAELFVYDRPTKNEASSETEEANGAITFSKVSCVRGRGVEIRASGVLGSEFSDGKPIRVNGTFRGTIGRPPLRSSASVQGQNEVVLGTQ